MKTFVPGKDDVQHKWYVVDAKGMILGRLATQVARVLCGKHKPSYVPFLDTGDFVIVINASQVEITGRKLDQKMYRYHTGYHGGLKEIQAKKLYATRPDQVIREAVQGMLPKTKLGRAMIKKLKVYRGAEHRHQAQQPEALKF
jgi:large subunit ribosomal protein L13